MPSDTRNICRMSADKSPALPLPLRRTYVCQQHGASRHREPARRRRRGNIRCFFCILCDMVQIIRDHNVTWVSLLVISCGTPSDGILADKAWTDDLLGSVLTYTCHTNARHVSGDLSRTCLDTRLWSGTAPECEGKERIE